jgi:hypothetical protein
MIRESHEPEAAKKKHRKLAFTLFRSLLDRKIVELIPGAKRGSKRVRVNVDLQEDFSLNHALSLYLIDTIAHLDPATETYGLDLLTLVESILESPDLILRKQLDRVKTEKMREMKEAGMEYDERIEELEKLEHPKPLRDFIYSTFNEFSDKHPWVGTDNIRPKSIAREMFETYQSFAEYVREYELQRAEGLLLRYLTDVYRAFVQTVPDAAKNDQADAIVEYFGSIVRSVDSSLLDEWERIRNPNAVSSRVAPLAAAPVADPTYDSRSSRAKVRNEVFRFLRTLSIGDFEAAMGVLSTWGNLADADGSDWTIARLEKLGREYVESGHSNLRTDPAARAAHFTRMEPAAKEWRIEQTLNDPEEHNDWTMVITVETASLAPEGPGIKLKLASFGPIGI